MNHEYTEEEKKELDERRNKVVACMAENHLGVSVQMIPVNIGNDTFAMKPQPFYTDLKYTPTSPETAPETIVEAEVVETTPETNDTDTAN